LGPLGVQEVGLRHGDVRTEYDIRGGQPCRDGDGEKIQDDESGRDAADRNNRK
jgi:hypothetical protein